MEIEYKTYRHNPPHLFIPNVKYFITGSSLHKIHYFKTDEIKEKILFYMFKSFKQFNWIIEDWVILENHYHLMAQSPQDVSTLGHVMNNFHRFSGLWIKKHLRLVGQQKVWHNYWDTCIDNDVSYFARVHYLWFNPVKHGNAKHPSYWKHGSYCFRNKDEIRRIEKYPFDKLKIIDDF